MGGNDNYKPLFNAIYQNDLNEIKTLIKEGAKVNETDEEKYTPLHIACMEGNLATQRFFYVLTRHACTLLPIIAIHNIVFCAIGMHCDNFTWKITL